MSSGCLGSIPSLTPPEQASQKALFKKKKKRVQRPGIQLPASKLYKDKKCGAYQSLVHDLLKTEGTT